VFEIRFVREVNRNDAARNRPATITATSKTKIGVTGTAFQFKFGERRHADTLLRR